VVYGWELLRQLTPGLQRVSVVVPNYNYARYLRARLASILGQSYPVFELLVLDDASTDDSTQVVAACQRDWERDITLIVNDRNSGSVFAQWRQGIDRARGDLLWIAEADDLATPDFLASLAPRFAATPALAMAFVDAAQIDGAGQRLGDSYAAYCGEYSSLDFHRDFSVSGATFLTQGLGVRNTVLNVSGVLFRREALAAALARVGSELERWTIAGDWRLYGELCRAGGAVHYVARPLNQHRRHAASVVGANDLRQHLAEITAMHELLAQDPRQEPQITQWREAYRQELEQRINAA
jgi:glycosyltransferase involved in cell wall biosynthesis